MLKVIDRFKNINFNLAKIAVIAGILLRLKSYLECRSLWVDECWSAIEVANRSFLEIIQHQFIFPVSSRPPTLFLLIEKVSVMFFGNNEWALKLPPFLFSVAAMIGFYYIVTRLLSQRAALVAVWLFAISEPLVFYAAEAKRYSSSIFSIIVILVFVYRFLRERTRLGPVLGFGCLGSTLLWLSNTSVFITVAVFIALVIRAYREKKFASLWSIAAAAIPFAVSCSLVYFLVLREMIFNKEMRSYFVLGLWQGKVFSLEQILWLCRVYYQSITEPVGLAFPLIMLGLIAFGLWTFAKKNIFISGIMAMTIILTLLAAGMGYYPFYGRVILFLLPLYFFLIAFSVDLIVSRYFKDNRWVLILILGTIFFRPIMEAVPYILQTRARVDNRGLFEFFKKNYQPGDYVYLNHGARYPFFYYASSLAFADQLKKVKYYLPGDKQSELFLIGVFVDVANYSKLTGIPIVYENLYFNEKGNFRKAYCLKDNGFKLLTHSQQSDYLARGRNWLLISHSEEVIVDESEILKSIFLKRGQLLLEYKAKGVGAYLFEIK